MARAELDMVARDREWLEHSVAELTAFGPEPGEEEILATRRAGMQRGEKIAGDLQAIADLLDGSEGGLARLRQAARALERVAGRSRGARRGAGGDRPRDHRGRRGAGQGRRGGGGARLRSRPARGGRDAAVRPARAGAQAPRPARRSCRAGRGAGRDGWSGSRAAAPGSPRSSARSRMRRAAYEAAADVLTSARTEAAVDGSTRR